LSTSLNRQTQYGYYADKISILTSVTALFEIEIQIFHFRKEERSNASNKNYVQAMVGAIKQCLGSENIFTSGSNFSTIFNGSLVLSWRSLLWEEETVITRENHRPTTLSHSQTLSRDVVLSTTRHSLNRTRNLIGDNHLLHRQLKFNIRTITVQMTSYTVFISIEEIKFTKGVQTFIAIDGQFDPLIKDNNFCITLKVIKSWFRGKIFIGISGN
jgi:hypothetical protein